MINCPKCGFNQPKDQYCANCGVDMINFKPEKPGLLKSIVNSSAFYLTVLAVAVFTVWHLWQHKKNETISERLRLTQNNYANLNSQTAKITSRHSIALTQTESVTVPNEISSPSDSSASAANNSLRTALEEAARAPIPNESATELDSSAASTARHLTYKVQISFYEASTDFINDLMAQSQNQGKFFNLTDYSFGALWGGNIKISDALKNREIKLLDTYSIPQLKLKVPHSKFIGYNAEDAEQNLGFDISLHITDQSETTTNLDFDVVRSFKPANDKNSSPIKKSFPGQLELKSNEAFFITGVLPYKVPSEIETEILSHKLFQIYQSAAYQNRNHNMILFIQITKNSY